MSAVHKEPPMVLNLDNIETKRRLMSKVQKLSGTWEVSLRPRRRTRSLSQNAYYWAAYVGPFTEWLREQWGDPSISTEQAHIELKKAVLGVREKLNEATGEVMELVPSSHDLDVIDFGNFLEKAAEFLARFAGIVVLPPEVFYERK